MFGRTCLTARERGAVGLGSIPPRLHVVPQRLCAAIGKPADEARILAFRHTINDLFRHFDFTFGYHRCFSTDCLPARCATIRFVLLVVSGLLPPPLLVALLQRRYHFARLMPAFSHGFVLDLDSAL
jgi:hypothetical protein